MKRRPREENNQAISAGKPTSARVPELGLVLSGGGARAAYQVGALRALIPYISTHPLTVMIGSSVGALNALVFAAGARASYETAVTELEDIWKHRTFKNTFAGSASRAFLRSMKLAVMQYLSPGPNPSSMSVFDPSPLLAVIDAAINTHGGLSPDVRLPQLRALAVMTTVETEQRRPLLVVSSHSKVAKPYLKGASFDICYVDELTAHHGFASAALPSVLPPVELDTEHGTVTLVDGGISQNVPVDPAVRLGAERVILMDVSGRDWWLNHFEEPHDTRPSWEVPADQDTFCLRPPETFTIRCQKSLGTVLQQAVGGSTRRFIAAVGTTWPIYTLLRNTIGEEAAYETMSYVALDPDYLRALIELGYNETVGMLRNREEPQFARQKSYQQWIDEMVTGQKGRD